MSLRYLCGFLISLALGAGVAAPANGQQVVCKDSIDVNEDPRAQQLRACRQEKEEHLTTLEPGFFERASSFISTQPLLTDFPVIDVELPLVPGLRPVLGGLRSGSGLTAGLRYEPLRGGSPAYFVLSGRASLKRYWGLRSILGYDTGGYQVYGFGTYQHIPQDPFYGVGPKTEDDLENPPSDVGLSDDVEDTARSNYRWDRAIVGALAGFRPAEGLLAGTHVAYQQNRLGAGQSDRYPDLRDYVPVYSDQFGRSTPGVVENEGNEEGLAIADVDYAIVGAYAEYDTRVVYSEEEGVIDLPRSPLYRNRFAPFEDRLQGISLDADRGVYLAVQALPHMALSDDKDGENYNFIRYEVEAEQYVPFRHGYQVLAFREFLSLSQTRGDDVVPFYMMDYIGGGSTIRGFDGFRFRDRNLVVFNTEYRWQAWFRMDVALFLDAGYAFEDFDQFEFDEIETGGGFGFRFRSSRRVVARIDFAWSREGMSTYLKLGSFL